jgi:lysozyme
MNYSNACIELVKKHEGCSLTSYADASGYSIGYGHFGVAEGQTITQADADALLVEDLNKVAETVNRYVTRALTQGQFDALCDFVFNLGTGVFHKSKLLYYVNTAADAWVASNLMMYVYSSGKIMQGLVNRRTDEVNMYKGAA